MDNNSPLRIVLESDCVIVQVMDAQGNLRDKINNGPVYDLKIAQQEVRKRKFFYATAKAAEDQYEVPGGNELRAFIEALTHHQHYNDSERCQTSPAITPPPWILDADSYAMNWNSDYQQEYGDAPGYYLKFGFSETATNFQIISMHES